MKEGIFATPGPGIRSAAVLAKTFQAMAASDEEAAALASCALNRLAYEAEIDAGAEPAIVFVRMFPCWRKARAMDHVEYSPRHFATARAALLGRTRDATRGARNFLGPGESAWWAAGLKPSARIGRYRFYLTCN
jgi:hypothetical protein